jgi:hypothetical protein
MATVKKELTTSPQLISDTSCSIQRLSSGLVHVHKGSSLPLATDPHETFDQTRPFVVSAVNGENVYAWSDQALDIVVSPVESGAAYLTC